MSSSSNQSQDWAGGYSSGYNSRDSYPMSAHRHSTSNAHIAPQPDLQYLTEERRNTAPYLPAQPFQSVSYEAPRPQVPRPQASLRPNPTYQSPTYQSPTYQSPTYQSPTYQSPTYQSPTYQSSTHQNPAYQNPTYQNAGLAHSTYQNSTHPAPASDDHQNYQDQGPIRLPPILPLFVYWEHRPLAIPIHQPANPYDPQADHRAVLQIEIDPNTDLTLSPTIRPDLGPRMCFMRRYAHICGGNAPGDVWRNVVSHMFGRNKRETQATAQFIPKCHRACYQRCRYAGNAQKANMGRTPFTHVQREIFHYVLDVAELHGRSDLLWTCKMSDGLKRALSDVQRQIPYHRPPTPPAGQVSLHKAHKNSVMNRAWAEIIHKLRFDNLEYKRDYTYGQIHYIFEVLWRETPIGEAHPIVKGEYLDLPQIEYLPTNYNTSSRGGPNGKRKAPATAPDGRSRRPRNSAETQAAITLSGLSTAPMTSRQTRNSSST